MKKGYVIGGLAVLGAIALISLYKKPKKNSEGFFGANGRASTTANGTASTTARGMCAQCRTVNGGVYHTGGNRNCNGGDRCITQYAFV